MALTRDFKDSVMERAKIDPSFANSLLDESLTLFLRGEPETARLMLRDLVNATIGFEQLAIETGTPAKSLHRMLSRSGNPGMNNFSAILFALQVHLGVKLQPQISDSDELASA